MLRQGTQLDSDTYGVVAFTASSWQAPHHIAQNRTHNDTKGEVKWGKSDHEIEKWQIVYLK